MKYAVCEISGSQYLIEPDKVLAVASLEAEKQLKVDKVLLLVDGSKVEVGDPYLKTSLNFEVVGQKRQKIRVATYKSKANHRRVVGSIKKTTLIKWTD